MESMEILVYRLTDTESTKFPDLKEKKNHPSSDLIL